MYHRRATAKVTTKGAQRYAHSSTKYNNSTEPPALTPLGECCMTRHLEDDYRLVKTMLGNGPGGGTSGVEPLVDAHPVIQKACLWGDATQQRLCRDDLLSMLSRRAKYLDRSQGICLVVVSTN